MPLWGNVDTVSGNQKPVFANTGPSTANTNPAKIMYGNVWGVSVTEKSNTSGDGPKTTHAGWVSQKIGTGGRAGRIQYETLVAMGSISSDNSADDTYFPGT